MIILDTNKDTLVTMRCGEYRSGQSSYYPNFLNWFAKHQATGEEKYNAFPLPFSTSNNRYVQFTLQTRDWAAGMWLFELRQAVGGTALTTILAWAQPASKTVANSPYDYTSGDTDTYHIYE
jgi:hypothetical protein